MSVLEFDALAHTYKLNGVEVPSVTRVIKPLGPTFGGVPPDVLENKRALGTAVHQACEYDDMGQLDDESTHAQLLGYVEGWRAFMRTTGAVVVANEQPLAHKRLLYAGTLDRVLMIRGEHWVIDIKTALHAHASYGVQLAAYEALCVDAGLVPKGLPIHRAAVLLGPSGTYRLARYESSDDWPAFVACLTLHSWKSHHLPLSPTFGASDES